MNNISKKMIKCSLVFAAIWGQLILTSVLWLSLLHLTDEKIGRETLGNLPEVTRLGSGRAQIWIRTVWLGHPRSCPSILCCLSVFSVYDQIWEARKHSWASRPKGLCSLLRRQLVADGDWTGASRSPPPSPRDIPAPSECSLWIPEKFWRLSMWMESPHEAAV